MSDYYDIEKSTSKRSKRQGLLDKLESIDVEEYIPKDNNSSSFFPSSTMKKKEKKKNDYDLSDEWFNEMMSFEDIMPKKSTKGLEDFGLGYISKKKKKKKKGEKSKEIDFTKEFEPETYLLKNLLVEQSRFTDSLQKEYDNIKSTKSSGRNITKQINDLISNITSARALSMQLVDKQVSIKKQAAELNMKQRKESGVLDSEDLSNFGATYLKNLLNNRQVLYNEGTGNPEIGEYSEDEMFNNISDILDNDNSIDRDPETELYLKYENRNVTTFVHIIDDDVENYEFICKDEEGNTIEDYPKPNHTGISVNRSTNIATDTFGKKYPILWD